MKRILFVCLGNICRSPTAEFVFNDLARRSGLAWIAESAATSGEEEGNPVDARAAHILRAHAIPIAAEKRARKVKADDYARYDLILGMEARNVARLETIFGGDPQRKLGRLLDGSERPRDISDPWYTGDFESAFADIREGCVSLVGRLRGTDLRGRN